MVRLKSGWAFLWIIIQLLTFLHRRRCPSSLFILSLHTIFVWNLSRILSDLNYDCTEPFHMFSRIPGSLSHGPITVPTLRLLWAYDSLIILRFQITCLLGTMYIIHLPIAEANLFSRSWRQCIVVDFLQIHPVNDLQRSYTLKNEFFSQSPSQLLIQLDIFCKSSSIIQVCYYHSGSQAGTVTDLKPYGCPFEPEPQQEDLRSV